MTAVGVSVARLVQQPAGEHAVLYVVTHEAPARWVHAALESIRGLPEAHRRVAALPVVSSRGVSELGWT